MILRSYSKGLPIDSARLCLTKADFKRLFFSESSLVNNVSGSISIDADSLGDGISVASSSDIGVPSLMYLTKPFLSAWINGSSSSVSVDLTQNFSKLILLLGELMILLTCFSACRKSLNTLFVIGQIVHERNYDLGIRVDHLVHVLRVAHFTFDFMDFLCKFLQRGEPCVRITFLSNASDSSLVVLGLLKVAEVEILETELFKCVDLAFEAVGDPRELQHLI